MTKEKLNISSVAKVYSFDNYIANRVSFKIEEVLRGMNVPATFINETQNNYTYTAFFAFNKIGDYSKRLERALTVLQYTLHLQSVPQVTYSLAPLSVAHFGIIIQNDIQHIANASEDDIKGLCEDEFLIGIDEATGETVKGSLYSIPHLLIGGASGSGKSVLLNNIIKSLIAYRNNNITLVLIDTKQVEFAAYEGSDDLCLPIAKDCRTAERYLAVLCDKMDERYSIMQTKGLKQWNGTKWVIAIDELADLMLRANSAKIEEYIVRIAQLGRACGIHLIIATQRPTVDVCTGLIKANIVNRIALQCASNKDSCVILDHKGAENLRGNGEAIAFIGNKTMKIQCFSA